MSLSLSLAHLSLDTRISIATFLPLPDVFHTWTRISKHMVAEIEGERAHAMRGVAWRGVGWVRQLSHAM